MSENAAATQVVQSMDKRVNDEINSGWFEVEDNPLSSVGVYQYSGRSIGGDAVPSQLYGVYRSAEELGNPETVDSFRLQPWTDDHPDALLGEPNEGFVAAEDKGVHGVIGEQTYFRDGTLYGNIKVFSQSLAKKIAAGKKELSCGYHCQFVKQDGVYMGEPYQYIQVGIRGNHLSSVDKGRMGAAVRVMDAAFTFALDMKEIATDVAGVSDAEKVTSSKNSIGDDEMAKDTKDDIELIKADTKPVGGKAGDDSLEDLKDKKEMKAKDAETEEEEGMDEPECVKDEDEEEKKKDAKDKAKDEDKDDEKKDAKDMKGKGMDAAEIEALIDARVSARVKAAMDTAETNAARRQSAKSKLYTRVSPIIGAFDHDEMSLEGMASYALDKLEAPKSKNPVEALDFFLAGRGNAPQTVTRRAALDKSEGSAVSRYLNS